MTFFTQFTARWKRYSGADARADFLAGLIVAIVALPLAIGFSIASGVPPEMGIYAAIIGGLLAGIFGGSEFNISGPTGAMVVVVLSVVAAHGIAGLILAALLAGIILILLGVLRLGKVIEYIPSPVIVGFTAGIATIIFFGQLNNFFGINPPSAAHEEFLHKTWSSLLAIGDANLAAVSIAVFTVGVLILCRRFIPKVPGSLVAVVLTTAAVMLLPTVFPVKVVEQIGTIPHTLPVPGIPDWTWELVRSLLPAAFTIAMLAAIESLLSAVVADGMTDTRHKPNKELVGSGIANIGSALFGGLPITGAIARTATNVRNGGRTRMAAIIHAILLFGMVFFVAGLAGKIPLATLAGILMFVAFNMVEWERVFHIFKTPASDIAVMLTTFALTVLVDLTVAIEVGLVLAAILFMKRMSDLHSVEELGARPLVASKSTDLVHTFSDKNISIYTVSGPLFFGAASRIDQEIAETPGGHKKFKIIRLRNVPVIDATGIAFIEGTVHKHKKLGGAVYFSGMQPNVRQILHESGVLGQIGDKRIFLTTRHALRAAIQDSMHTQGSTEREIDQALSRWDLSTIDEEERSPKASVQDRDPVSEVFDAVGIRQVQAAARTAATSVFGPRSQHRTKKKSSAVKKQKKKEK